MNDSGLFFLLAFIKSFKYVCFIKFLEFRELIVCKDIPEYLRKYHSDWSNHRLPWLTRAKLAEDYFLNDVDGTGSTFTAQQSKRIKDTLNMNVSLNFIYPLLDQKHAILIRSKPSHKIVPIDTSSKDMAHVLDKMKHAVLYNSMAEAEIEEMTKDMLVSGMGIAGIFDEDPYQIGEFGITYMYLHYSEVIFDPYSRRRSGQDQRGVWTEIEIPLDQAKLLYDPIIQEINDYYGKDYTMEYFAGKGNVLTISRTTPNISQTDPKQTVIVRNFYRRKLSKVYFQEKEEGGDFNRIFEENFFPEEWEALNTGESGIFDSEENMFCERTLMLGDKVVMEQMKPIYLIPLRASYYQWGGSPYRSYGMIHWERPKQEALDKSLQIMLLNGMVSNNAGWMIPKGSMTKQDMKQLETHGAKPGVAFEYTPVTLHGKIFVPERIQIQAISNFFPMLIDMLKSAMEYSTRISPVISGNVKEAKVDVFSVLQQYQDAAMQSLMRDIARVNQSQEYLGNVVIQYLIATLEPDKYYTFLDEKGKLNEYKIAKDAIRDYKLGRYKVVAVPSEAMPTQRMNMALELMKVAQSTQDPNKRDYYIQTAFSLSDFRAFDEIAEDIDKINELSQQVEGLQEALKRSEELMKQRENAQINAEIKTKIAMRLMQAMERISKAEAKEEDMLLIDRLKKQLAEKENGKE